MDSPRRERWLRPTEVASLFAMAGVPVPSPSVLRAWAAAGRITSSRTLGRHRRYPESEARQLVEQSKPTKAVA